MWSLGVRLPVYALFRRSTRPPLFPASVAFNVLYACNSRCKTCNIYERKVTPLRLDEFDRIFASLGTAPTWAVLTGGEPFLRKDMPDIALALARRCRPSFVTIATNGTFPERTVAGVERIVAGAPGTDWVVNLSLDDLGERHDEIRQTPKNWEHAMETYRGLRALAARNLTVGIHTCLSAFNAHRFEEIHDELLQLHPDSYIVEMAEERGELLNANEPIEPSEPLYRHAVGILRRRLLGEAAATRATRLVRALRLRYYALTEAYLSQRTQMVPCMAGWMSAHVGADGEVWTCSTRAQPIGRLREVDYDFGRVWYSPEARAMRRSIRNRECACPMVSSAYMSMIADWRSLGRIARDYLQQGSST
jgi:MoaA/NifB/PqqE/SkfB family radical SAM enzyme